MDLLNGGIGSLLLYISTPIIIINLLRIAYNVVDTFWLGHLSTKALEAIGLGFPIIFLLISIGMGLAIAGSIFVAQFEGSEKDDMVNFAAAQTITFSLGASILLGGIGYFLAEDLLRIYGASPRALTLGTGYLQIIFLGLFFLFGFGVFIALMRGYGDTVTPMYIMLGSVIANLILDPFLIFGWSIFPELGIEGAAIATVFCRGAALLFGLYILFTGVKGIKISPSKMLPDFKFLKRLISVGVPASIGSAGRSVSVNLLIAIVGMFSTTIVAGYAIGVRITMVLFFPAMAVSRGVSTMAGQNLGAQNFQRADDVVKTGAKYTFLILSAAGLLIFIFPEILTSIFSEDPRVVEAGSNFLRWTALSLGFVGIMRSICGGFRGAGRTLWAALITIIALGFVRVPIALFASLSIGATGIWIAFPISNISGASVAYLWLKGKDWKQKIVE